MITACSRNDGANPILSIGVGFVEFLIGELSAMRETSAFEDGPDNGMLLALEKLFVHNWCFVPEESRTVFVTMTFTVCALSRSPGTERIQTISLRASETQTRSIPLRRIALVNYDPPAEGLGGGGGRFQNRVGQLVSRRRLEETFKLARTTVEK
jgi:hypothetical protein